MVCGLRPLEWEDVLYCQAMGKLTLQIRVTKPLQNLCLFTNFYNDLEAPLKDFKAFHLSVMISIAWNICSLYFIRTVQWPVICICLPLQIFGFPMNLITALMWTVMNFIKNNLIIPTFLIIHCYSKLGWRFLGSKWHKQLGLVRNCEN